jgi:hypothetical protein
MSKYKVGGPTTTKRLPIYPLEEPNTPFLLRITYKLPRKYRKYPFLAHWYLTSLSKSVKLYKDNMKNTILTTLFGRKVAIKRGETIVGYVKLAPASRSFIGVTSLKNVKPLKAVYVYNR